MKEKIEGTADYRFIAVEPASCPSLTQVSSPMTSVIQEWCVHLEKNVHTGQRLDLSSNHAGGLRYHGMSSVLSQLYHDGLMEQ